MARRRSTINTLIACICNWWATKSTHRNRCSRYSNSKWPKPTNNSNTSTFKWRVISLKWLSSSIRTKQMVLTCTKRPLAMAVQSRILSRQHRSAHTLSLNPTRSRKDPANCSRNKLCSSYRKVGSTTPWTISLLKQQKVVSMSSLLRRLALYSTKSKVQVLALVTSRSNTSGLIRWHSSKWLMGCHFRLDPTRSCRSRVGRIRAKQLCRPTPNHHQRNKKKPWSTRMP